MPPPNKRQRQLHRLLDVKKQNRETERIDFELADEEQVAIIDDDFDLDGLSQNQELLQSRWEDLIKWNPAAEHSLRSAYTGDSRATKYRRLKEEEKRRRSVADCARIETFFAKSSAPIYIFNLNIRIQSSSVFVMRLFGCENLDSNINHIGKITMLTVTKEKML